MPTDTLARTFEEYSTRYRNVAMERDDAGVLTVTLNTDGDSLVWTQHAHDALGYCFTDIAADRDNSAVILTGAGESFCAEIDAMSFKISTASLWDNIIYEGKRLLSNLLDIEVPVIAAVNGPAIFHPEIPIMSDIVIASETATFQDGPHYCAGVVPGDGAHVVWPHVIGPNRGRYFLLTGQVLDARTAMDYGAVSEVVPADQLMDRARAVAADVASKPFLTRRYGRAVLTQSFKRTLAEGIHMGLALEGLAALDQWPTDGTLKQG